MKTFKQYIVENQITLGDILNNILPEENEVLYNFINKNDFSKLLTIKKVDPKKLLTYKGDMTIQKSFEFADKESKDLVKYYRKNLNETPIILYGNKVIDGNHRAMAAILNKTFILAVDLNEISNNENL